MTTPKSNGEVEDKCAEYGHVVGIYDVCMVYCTVCDKDLMVMTEEEYKSALEAYAQAIREEERRVAKLAGYSFAIKHFKERLEMGQSFEDAVVSMERIALTPDDSNQKSV